MQAVKVSWLSLQFQLVRTGQDGVDTGQCRCQCMGFPSGIRPCMACVQGGPESADGVIHFFCFFFFLQKPSLEKKKGEKILLEGFWAMSWPVVMPSGSRQSWWHGRWREGGLWLHLSAQCIIFAICLLL